ncbi:hypothetical protein FHU30_007356 [Actinomadura rupiterrae]|nr:hypothetical protein [Actinomadura rupiterrae]
MSFPASDVIPPDADVSQTNGDASVEPRVRG